MVAVSDRIAFDRIAVAKLTTTGVAPFALPCSGAGSIRVT
jgi:hypothetical protein